MRVGIVNDLALARECLRRVLTSVPGFVPAWLASDGTEAVRLARQDPPDAILMDLLMPNMGGAEATRRIMAEAPCAILVVTSDIHANYRHVLDALSAGAVEAFQTPTPVTGGEAILDGLSRAVHLRQARLPTPEPPLVALGASTDGPQAVARILSDLPRDFPGAVVVIQHIGAGFADNLMSFLQTRSALPVEAAVEGTRPVAGRVFVAASDDHLILRPGRTFGITPEPLGASYRPGVSVFFESAAAWPMPGVAVVLTGMGDDGASGLATLRKAGWLTIAQDRETSTVYGMPRAAAERNAAVMVLPLGLIAGAILGRVRG